MRIGVYMKIKNKFLRIIVRSLLVITVIFSLMIVGLWIYASQSYDASNEMYAALDNEVFNSITIHEDFGSITYTPEGDKDKNIIIIPGGLVSPESYAYLATHLANEGHMVTIVKPLFNLAIIQSNQALKYVNDDMFNVIIGHSLGGVVGSMIAGKSEAIDAIILLASYPTDDISDKYVLSITASNDLVLDQAQYELAMENINLDDAIFVTIDGGNHAQFGWYGPQKGDGEAEISTLSKQQLIISNILLFLDSIPN